MKIKRWKMAARLGVRAAHAVWRARTNTPFGKRVAESLLQGVFASWLFLNGGF